MIYTPTQIRAALRNVSARATDMYGYVLQNEGLSIGGDTPSADIAAASDLENYGFVFRRSRPTGYDLLPTPYEILIPSLLHRLDWSYPPFAGLPATERQQLQDDLLELRENSPATFSIPLVSPELPRTIEGAAHIDTFVAGILKEAEEVRALSAAEWSTNLPLVWAALVQEMERGMTYRRIVSPLGLAAFGWKINDRDTRETGVNLRVHLSPSLSPFYLFTGPKLRSALVFAHPTCDDTQRRATYTALGQLTQRLSEMFDDLWQTAVPAQSVLRRLRTHAPHYVERAHRFHGDAGARVATALFDKGIFAELAEEDQEFLSSLVDSGVAIRSKFKIGLTNCVPNIVDEIARYVRQEQEPRDGE